MSFGKELLLSCIVVMHVSSVASMPLKLRMEYIVLSFCNLMEAEREYVKQMFPEFAAPRGNNSSCGERHRGDPGLKCFLSSLRPLEGITLPVGNDTEEIRASTCAISDYLDNHLRTIVTNQTKEHKYLIDQIKAFHIQFKAAVDPGEHTWCHRNVTTSHAYAMKVFGIQIIHFARKWVEGFTNGDLDSDC